MLNIPMRDASRLFAAFPRKCDWENLKLHLAQLGASQIVSGPQMAEIENRWLYFRFSNFEFSIGDQYHDYSFFSQDASCNEVILQTIIDYFEPLIGPCGES